MNLIQHAQEFIKKHGLGKSIEEFNRLDSPFNVKSSINPFGDLYLFTVDKKGVSVVHGKEPKIRDKPMLQVQDQDGVFFIKEMADRCFQHNKAKVAYRWPNPISNQLEPKVGYVEKIPGHEICIGTGWYK